MKSIILILGDQLSHAISSLKECNKSQDLILMCEIYNETKYVKHHKKKLVYIFSAMRSFSKDLQAKGYKVNYVEFNPKEKSSFTQEVQRQVKEFKPDKLIVTEPGEYRVLKEIEQWQKKFKIEVDIKEDERFLTSINDFRVWSSDKKQLRMEFFYRDIRKKYKILMEDDRNPIGGKWNLDSENRKSPPKDLKIPNSYQSNVSDITKAVIKLVNNNFQTHFGDIEPFNYAVTRKEAKKALTKFINERLKYFGSYQDAMIQDEPWMFHSHISMYLNSGLLLPLECVKAAEEAYISGLAPLNSVEGFIRQIIGWREFVRGIYWLKMPDYKNKNFFQSKRSLPEFYWSGNSKMNCINQCVLETKKNAYAHHIQRLMVLGNFALIAGIDPKFVNEWFLVVYADAYEWVELPNVTGMALFADGGFLASKPYCSGGAYINRMSNYCKGCSYSIKEKTGDKACPFNYLYWNFLIKHKDKLENNPRMAMMYRTLSKMDENNKKNIQKSAKKFISNL